MQANNTTKEAGEYDPPASAADIYSDLEAWQGAHHDLHGEHVCVTQHAQQRFLERVSGSEPFPRSRIEREFQEAHRVKLDDPDITDPTRIHPESGVVYVFDPDDGTVMTCFIPTEEQLKQGNDVPGGRRAVA
jgi:hypothetical protein